MISGLDQQVFGVTLQISCLGLQWLGMVECLSD